MNLQWKAYRINLEDLEAWLTQNHPKTDGINASIDSFIIVEIEPLTDDEKNQIIAYYDSMPEYTDTVSRSEKLTSALLNYKGELLLKDITTYSILDKKVLLSLPITKDEEDQIIVDYYTA